MVKKIPARYFILSDHSLSTSSFKENYSPGLSLVPSQLHPSQKFPGQPLSFSVEEDVHPGWEISYHNQVYDWAQCLPHMWGGWWKWWFFRRVWGYCPDLQGVPSSFPTTAPGPSVWMPRHSKDRAHRGVIIKIGLTSLFHWKTPGGLRGPQTPLHDFGSVT